MKKNLIFLMILISFLLVLTQASAECDNDSCSGKVCVFYFYSPDCHFCQQTKPFIDSLEGNYSINVHRYNVKELDSYNIYNKFCNIQNVPVNQRGIPLAVIGTKFFMGYDQIMNNLEKEIADSIKNNRTECPMPEVCSVNQTSGNSTDHQPIANITKVTLPLITVAAAADSINPCAIGVLIFLVGFLLLSSGGNKKKTLTISIIYIITVYAVYFLAGIGILAVLSKLAFLGTLTKVFAAVIVLFGLININDSFKEKAILAIPESSKPLIHSWVYKASVPAAIVLGIIVASVELPCTGGMYLAILALLANSATQASAFWYLAYYNLIFVMPLVLITLLFIFGLEAEQMQQWTELHKRKARIIIGVVLVVIGILLFIL